MRANQGRIVNAYGSSAATTLDGFPIMVAPLRGREVVLRWAAEMEGGDKCRQFGMRDYVGCPPWPFAKMLTFTLVPPVIRQERLRSPGRWIGNQMKWADGKSFAFTIFDDPDNQTVENGSPVYNFLYDNGFLTTKAVWPIRGKENPKVGGSTCEDQRYLQWCLGLQRRGYEIAMHNVTFHTSTRAVTHVGMERFRELFGHYPRTFSNHTGCLEGIYWGNSRLSGMRETLYNLLVGNAQKNTHQGHVETSPLFWGDMCREKIDYVRNFVFKNTNVLEACPTMPYHDPTRPYVKHWFSACEGPTVRSFVKTISEARQDQLESEGGACIMYTHLAMGFYEGGALHTGFTHLMGRLGQKNGWFVPVEVLLDYLLRVNGSHDITPQQRRQLELRWILSKLRTGGRT